jgi:hypothetical protein
MSMWCSGRSARSPSCAASGLVAALSAYHRQGVAEVASIGSFERQYQVIIDPQTAPRHPARSHHRRHPLEQSGCRWPHDQLHRDFKNMIRGRLSARHG